MIIEYVPYGDLLGYLRKSRGLNDNYFNDPDIKPQTSLSSLQLMLMSWQIADGMSYLSSRKVSSSHTSKTSSILQHTLLIHTIVFNLFYCRFRGNAGLSVIIVV